jgi:predicted small lipoprotein YifL
MMVRTRFLNSITRLEIFTMKRMLLSGLGAAFLCSVIGCGGGGVEEGLPPSTKSDVPLDSVGADMSKNKVNTNALPKGSESGAPAEKDKK